MIKQKPIPTGQQIERELLQISKQIEDISRKMFEALSIRSIIKWNPKK